ncbi:unannotated protein [freshwater metagenome]|uniref:Unannotated protein n=1 Tax=freshwater metagenome TaxID=449393 RepID=A0A6J6MIX4_9ZZZZ
MNTVNEITIASKKFRSRATAFEIELLQRSHLFISQYCVRVRRFLVNERGDVPGWVLVVLMTTGLVTAIWTIAAPRLTAILRNSLDAMNGIR